MPFLLRRRPILFLVGVGLVGGIAASQAINGVKSQRRLNAAFSGIQKGMSEDEVTALMGSQGRSGEATGQIWWDDHQVEVAAAQVGKEIWYSPTATFLFPISFAVTFDRDGRVIGKHRYD